ncbi:MAG: Uma2 family endonuclease [Cyanobacteria bacterium P01_D01_bin.1]
MVDAATQPTNRLADHFTGWPDGVPLPDHTQLPESDGTFVKNFQEHPQSMLLTSSIQPLLDRLHPDGNYAIGQDCGIYWQLGADPPEKGAEAPDWFYVPNVPPLLNGKIRRSYVMWQEYAPPLIALEFASGNGSEERDRTPLSRTSEGEVTKPGKFWVYETAIRIPYYAIYEIKTGKLEVYRLEDMAYQKLEPNARGRYEIASLGVELGVWRGHYVLPDEQSWLRWWDRHGQMMPSGEERAEQESQRAEQEGLRAEQESQRADRLAQKLRELGIDPDAI